MDDDNRRIVGTLIIGLGFIAFYLILQYIF